MSDQATTSRARTTMSAADRREALIDCAQALFFEKGYEPTTINDIIARAGVSKGGFYHHFAAKEELLEAVVKRLLNAAIAESATVLDEPGVDALTRLNRFFERSVQWKMKTVPKLRELTLALMRPENYLLFQHLLTAVAAAMEPLIVRVLREGAEEGVIDPPDPQIVAELFMALSDARRSILRMAIQQAEAGDIDTAAEMMESRMRAESAIVERLLGVKPGSFVWIKPGRSALMLRAMFSDLS